MSLANAQDRSIFFVTLPKSGTDFTWNTLVDSSGLNMPEFIRNPNKMAKAQEGLFNSNPEGWSNGDFTAQRLDLDGMKRYLPTGYVFGTHMMASYHNIFTMEESGVGKVTVLFRDPRDATVSWTYHVAKAGPAHHRHISKFCHIPPEYYDWDHQRQISFQVRTFLPLAVNWIESWLSYYADPERRVDVQFVYFDRLKQDSHEYFKDIFEFHGTASADFSKIPEPVWGERHFRKGEHDQWTYEFSDDDKSFSKSLIGDRLEQAFAKAQMAHWGWRRADEKLESGRVLEAAKEILSVIHQFPACAAAAERYLELVALQDLVRQDSLTDENRIRELLDCPRTGPDNHFLWDTRFVGEMAQLIGFQEHG